MPADKPFPSRAIVELNDGTRYATAWGTRAEDAAAAPLSSLLNGRLRARIVGTEDYVPVREIACVIEEIMRVPDGPQHKRIVLQHQAPNETPKGRKLLGGAAKFVERLDGMSLPLVDEIIESPTSTWPGWNGATVYSNGRFQVVVGERWSDADCIMSVSRDDPNQVGRAAEPRSAAEDPRRASGHKADHRRSVPTNVPDFLDRLKEYGFEVDDTRRHYVITHPKRAGVSASVPRTPSDYRWADNQVADIRKTFGIDVRKPLD